MLGLGQVTEATQFDEILDALDAPTRAAGRRLVHSSAGALAGRGLDLNDSLGNLGRLFDDAAEIAASVRSQRGAVRGLIRDTGTVLDALSSGDRELAGAITGANETFGGLADADDRLAETVFILPTFEREATLTLERLERLRRNAAPVVAELLPVADDVSPTLRSLRRLSPSLRHVFADADPLLDAAAEGFPALRQTLAELRSPLRSLDPFLANLDPVLRYLYAYRNIVTGFLANPLLGLTGTLPEAPGQPSPRHLLRILPYFSTESLSVHPTRLATNRGNGYVPPTVTPIESGTPSGYAQEVASGAFANFDCKNTDYTESSSGSRRGRAPLSRRRQPGGRLRLRAVHRHQRLRALRLRQRPGPAGKARPLTRPAPSPRRPNRRGSARRGHGRAPARPRRRRSRSCPANRG